MVEAQSTYVGQLKEAPYRIVGICMSTQKYKDTEDCLNEALRKARHSDELKSIWTGDHYFYRSHPPEPGYQQSGEQCD